MDRFGGEFHDPSRASPAALGAAGRCPLAGPVGRADATQYDLVNVNTPFGIGEAYGVYRGHVVGVGTLQAAAYWPTPSAAPVSLNPANFSGSIAWGISGNQ